LLAIGLTEDETTSSLRFSLGDSNTQEEIEKLAVVIASVVEKSKSAANKKVFK
jgi:cysteine desulfurase